MSTREWVLSRTPPAPPVLSARIVESLGKRGASHARPTDVCLDAAVELLGRLLAQERVGRDDALDLLTVDALVTYAFEAAAEQIESVDTEAAAAMLRLAALADSDEPIA